MGQSKEGKKHQEKLYELILKNKYEVEVNFCSNIDCVDAGVLGNCTTSLQNKLHRLICKTCNNITYLYNNYAILKSYEEMTGIRYLNDIKIAKQTCKNTACSTHGFSPIEHPTLYKKNGKSKSGGQRYKCKGCKKTITIAKQKSNYAYHRKDHKDKMIFMALVHGLGIRRMSYLNEVNSNTIYSKLEFFYEQCLRFNQMMDGKIKKKKFKELRLSHDALHVTTNWRVNPQDDAGGKAAVQLTLEATVCNKTGFVFVQTIPFDSSVKSKEINEWADKTGEIDKLMSDRKYPNYIFHKEAVAGDVYLNSLKSKNSKFDDIYGIKISKAYHSFGHWYAVNKLLKNTKRLVVYADNEFGRNPAIPKIFLKETLQNKFNFYRVASDFFHQNKKSKNKGVKLSKEMLNKYQSKYKDEETLRKNNLKMIDSDPSGFIKKIKETEWGIVHSLTKESVEDLTNDVPYTWLQMATPKDSGHNKKIKLENKPIKTKETKDISNDIMNANLWSSDVYFLKLRTLPFFQRTKESTTERYEGSTVWKNGRSYDPKKLVMMAEIYKTYHNFINIGKDKTTPAQKLGLTKKQWTINQILTKKYKQYCLI